MLPSRSARPAHGRTGFPVRQPFLGVLSLWLLTWCLPLGSLRAQNDTTGDPTGINGDAGGLVTTGGSFDGFNGNAKRAVTDLVVPGAVGTIPLAFTRYYNSRFNATSTGFADGGWRHSYQWGGVISSNGNGATVYAIGYPDGQSVNFRLNRATAPAGETYARGQVGTSDRLEIASRRVAMGNSSSPVYGYHLHLSDGTQVHFTASGSSLTAGCLEDVHGSITQLVYGYYTTTPPSGSGLGAQRYYVLTDVIEPGGRDLHLQYGTLAYAGTTSGYSPAQWMVITSVSYTGASGTALGVSYNYTVFPPQTSSVDRNNTTYAALTTVIYPESSTNGGYVQALYTYVGTDIGYGGDTNADTTGAGAPPLLVSADDPHFAGPMSHIRYSYVSSSVTGAWGVVLSENNFTTGEVVSRLDQDYPGAPTRSTNTRGDHADTNNTAIARVCYYGQTSTNAGTTNALAFQPTTVTDFQNNSSYLTYNPAGSANGQGYVASSTDASNVTTQFATEPLAGKVKRVTLADGRVRKTSWAGVDPTNANQLTANNPYFVTSTTDERGNTTTYTRYGNTGYVYEIDYPDGGVERFDYTGFTVNGNTYYKPLHHYTKLGATITYSYGNNGGTGHGDLLTGIERQYNDAAGNAQAETTYLHYDNLDRPDKVTDQRNVSESYSYNLRHQRIQVLHAGDNTHQDFTYDDYGRCLKVSDELTHVTTTSYDEYNRPTSVTQPVSTTAGTTRVTSMTYERRDANNNVIGDALSHTAGATSYQVLPSGRGVRRIYTPNGWLSDECTGQTQGSGNSLTLVSGQYLHDQQSLGYDAAGRLLQSEDAQGQPWQRSYDGCGRLATTTDPLGHVTTTTYYASSSTYAGLVEKVDAPGNNATTTTTTQYTGYDAMGRCTDWVDPQNNAFGSGYDPAGNLAAQTDGMPTNQHPATQYAYDQLGRKGRITFADGTYQQWSYDASGNLASYRNRAGSTQTYSTYDARNRPTGYSWNDGITPAAGLAFDAAGRCTGYSNGYSNLVMSYDDAGVLKSEQECIGGGSSGPTITYTPDADGTVAKLSYPSGDTATWDRDFLDRVTESYVSVPSLGVTNQPLVSYSYSAGWLTHRGTVGGAGTDLGYQANGRVDLVHQYANGGGNISWRTYGYYPDGQMSWFAKANVGGGGALEDDRGDAYYYQGDGQLAYVDHESQNVQPSGVSTSSPPAGDSSPGAANTPERANSYQYDAAGNRTYDNESGTVTQPTFTNENLFYSYGYDGNRNTTTAVTNVGGNNEIWDYTYDAFGQLLTATPYGSSTPTASFVYDPLGRLCERTVGGVTSYLFYAGNKLIEEDSASNGTGRVASYMYGAGGERADRLGADYSSTFYHYDARGFVTHLSNGAGASVEQYLYDAFGKPLVYDPTGNTSRGQASAVSNNRFLWAADYEWYAELGLYRCGARFYDPSCGRWLQPDPIGQAGGLNVYGYCGNDPINLSDPSGLDGDPDSQQTGSTPKQSIGLSGDMAWAFASTGMISENVGIYSGGFQAVSGQSSGGGYYYFPPDSGGGTSVDSNGVEHVYVIGSAPIWINTGFNLASTNPLFLNLLTDHPMIDSISYFTTMKADTDGSPTRFQHDHSWQPDTSVTNHGQPYNAVTTPYAAAPESFLRKNGGSLIPGNLATIGNPATGSSNTVPTVDFGGDDNLPGEMSIAEIYQMGATTVYSPKARGPVPTYNGASSPSIPVLEMFWLGAK